MPWHATWTSLDFNSIIACKWHRHCSVVEKLPFIWLALIWPVAIDTILQLSAQWPGRCMAARLKWTLFWERYPSFCCVKQAVLMLTRCIYMTKTREICIKTTSTLASLPCKGQVTEETTVKWSVAHPGQGKRKGKWGWCSGESTHLPPMWVVFDSSPVSSITVCGLSLLLALVLLWGFSPGSLVFLPLQKPTSLRSNLTRTKHLQENQLRLMWLPL